MQLGEDQYLSLEGTSILFRVDANGSRWFQLSWLVSFLKVREKALLQDMMPHHTLTDGSGDYVSEMGLKRFLLQNAKPEWESFTRQFIEFSGASSPPIPIPKPKESKNKKFSHAIGEGSHVSHLDAALYLDKALRYFVEDGDAWFFARDVCQLLGFSNSWRTMAAYVPIKHLTKRSVPSARILNRALFVHAQGVIPLSERSRQPGTAAFRIWFEDTFLPALHKPKSKKVKPLLPSPEPESMPHLEASTVDTIRLFEEAEGLFYVFLRKGFAKEQAIDAALNALKSKLTIDVEVFRQLFETSSVGKGVIRPVKG